LHLIANSTLLLSEEHVPHLRQVVGLSPANAEGTAHRLPGSVPVDTALLGLPQNGGLGLPGALVEAAKVEKEVDKLLVAEVWYPLKERIEAGLQEVELVEVLRRLEVGVEEAPGDSLACFGLSHCQFTFRAFQTPPLFSDLGMAGAAEDRLVGGSFDFGATRSSHATRLDVVDLQVPGGAANLAEGFGSD